VSASVQIPVGGGGALPKMLADQAFVSRPAEAAQSPDAKLAKMQMGKPALERGSFILPEEGHSQPPQD
jgi:hypothetical protein